MDKLWAPWRINYVTQKKTKGCILCKAYRGKKDKDNFIIYRSRHCFSLLNIFPYNNGHMMVVVNRHSSDLFALNEEELLDLMITTRRMVSLLKKVFRPGGFNIGINIGKMSGAGINNHLHIHIVPRWQGDTNFMPVLSNTKIIAQSLGELSKVLRKEIDRKR